MATFSEFYESLLELAKSYEAKNTQLKIKRDLDADIVKIFGEKIDSLSMAKNGIEDVAELAYTTAEHHPFWNLLYQCSQISKTSLDKWNDEFSKEELDEISWSIAELKNTCEKLKERLNNDE